MVIEFCEPDNFDIQQLVWNLNPADERELLAIGVEPLWGIRHSIETSKHAMSVRIDGNIACIVGLSVEDSLGEPSPRPWLFGTPLLFADHRTFIRSTRKVLDLWLSEFPEVSNYVDARHSQAISWLKHFGAELGEPEAYGPLGRLFHKFTFRRS